MAVPKAALMTADEFREMPEGPPFFQLVEGEIFMSPSPERFHQQIISNLFHILNTYVRKRRLGRVYFAPLDVYLSELNVFEPDLMFISNARKGVLGRWIEGAPDFVAEVLSPSTARLDKRKRKIYAGNGVEEMLILDPQRKTIEVYDLRENTEHPKSTFCIGDKIASASFPGLKVSVTEVFAE